MASKYFRYVNDFYVYFLQEFQIRAQLMAETFYKKPWPNEIILWFQS